MKSGRQLSPPAWVPFTPSPPPLEAKARAVCFSLLESLASTNNGQWTACSLDPCLGGTEKTPFTCFHQPPGGRHW